MYHRIRMDPGLVVVWSLLLTVVLSEELFVTTQTSVLHIDTSTLRTSTIVTKENGRLLGLAADWRGGRLYYTDVSPTGGGIYTANLQGGDVRKLPIQYPDMEPVGLAVDWVYGHLYWTDTVYRAVMMSNLDGTGRVTIVTKDLIIPRGIAVHPDRRELYVGDQGKHAVQVCGLDGRNCRELNVTDDSATFWPNQIAIDYSSQKVHWTDGWVPALYSCSIGGTDCQKKTGNLSTELGSNPAFGLAVGQSGQLYLSTLHNQSLYRSSLDLELTSVQIDTSETKTFFLIKKETGSSLPAVVTTNPCATNKGGCSDICVPHSGDNFTCMCPDGSGKLPVNKMCQAPDQFLLFTDISRGIVGMASVDDSEMQTTIARAVKPLAVVYHQTEKKVYFADARLRAIYKCNLDGSDVQTVLNSSHGIGQVEGLSIDYRQNRLYFSNMGFEEYDGVLRSWHTIEMVDLDSKQRRTIVTSLEKPRAVVVDSERRVLYYTDWGSAGHVGRVGLDGSNKAMLTTAENPNDLIISDNKLLIINNKQPTAEIIEIDLANSNGVTNSRQLFNVEPMSLSISGGNLLVSSFTGGLSIYSKSSLSRTFSSILGQFTRMTVVDTTITKQRDEGVCSNSESCSGICVTSSQSTFFTCLCPTDEFNEQTSDRLSCQKPNSYLLFADIDGIKMVPQGNTGDNHVYTIVYPSADCSHFYGLVVDDNQQYIYFSALQGNSIFRANVDGSNMEKFVTDANGKVTSLALAGSDLFWTTTNTIDNSTGAIVHCNTGDTSRTVTVLRNTTAEPLDIAADESNIYWTERGRTSVKRLDRRDNVLRSLSVGRQTSAIGLTVPSRHLLYATDQSVTLRRFPASSGSYLVDTITEAGVRNLKPTRQFLYLSRWWGNNTGSVTRHDLITKKNYYVTNSTIRPGQMVYISDQAISVQDKVGSCPSIGSCSSTACFLDVDCYGSSKCCGTSQCTRCSVPEQGSNCVKDGVFIENSGGAVNIGCEKCSCLNGNLTCDRLVCPDLGSCPTEYKNQPSGSCCLSCSVTTACSSPPTIENCPISTKSFLLPSNSDTVNVTLDDVISTATYGKSCSGQKLNIDFRDTSLKYRPNVQTVTVSASDKHGTATCTVSIHLIDDTKPVFESCPVETLQIYVTESNRVVTWPPVTARDNSGSVTLTPNLENGVERPADLYAINYEAVDGSGNSKVCTFSVKVIMLQACKSPPIPFNGLLSCKDATELTCQLENCNAGYLNTLSLPTQTHTCDQTSGQWVPPFPSNFTNVCVKPRPSIIQREYNFEFNCPNSEFDAGDLQECISNARLCPKDDIKLCDRPFKRIQGVAESNSLMNINMKMEGTLPYGGNLADLTSRMDNAGRMIEGFFQTGNFKTKCPKITCPFTKATSKPDIRKCDIGSKTFIVQGKEICAPCPAGWFYNMDGDCSQCPSNTFQERTGQTICTPCPEKTSSPTGSFLQLHCIQSLSQSGGNTDTMNMLTIVIPVIAAALVILFLVVVIACFLKRKKASQQPSKREEKFQNPIFIGQGNDAFSGPSVEEYDQIPADKMLSESQIHNFKKVVSEGDYESSANLPGQDHTYQGLKEAKGATNKAFGQSNHDSSDDYDSPHDPVSNDYVIPLA